jgi:hypothetical protein
MDQPHKDADAVLQAPAGVARRRRRSPAMTSLTCAFCGVVLPPSRPIITRRNKRKYCSDLCVAKDEQRAFAAGIAGRDARRIERAAYSELMVCADLLRRGFHVYRSVSSTSGCDLVAIHEDRVIRVEVKTAVRRKSGELKGLLRDGQPSKHDVLALVAYDGEIQYVPEVGRVLPEHAEFRTESHATGRLGSHTGNSL